MTTDFKKFIHSLIIAAKRQQSRIILPESDDTRILAAAARAQSDGIADCVLLGEAAGVRKRAHAANIALPAEMTIISPDLDHLASLLATWRAHKKLDKATAKTWLAADTVAVAATMVRNGEADGVVAGAATASAAVLRPVLQIIGAAEGISLVSSCFLMCLPQGVKLFADCALNVRPTAAQLADIAVQSAQTIARFGIAPTVAMLSYITGNIAVSDEVARVHEATTLAQTRLPNVPVVGPIQYDAAVSPTIAAQKAPHWAAAGQATVLIFPDITSGNIAYKAVQQAANVIAIGPLMQGLAAPANDLSRGATIDDIYYTIAATAAQK